MSTNALQAVVDGMDRKQYRYAGACHTSGDGRIYSYGVLIAAVDQSGHYHMNTQKYSVTTSKHQNACRRSFPASMIIEHPSEEELRAAVQ